MWLPGVSGMVILLESSDGVVYLVKEKIVSPPDCENSVSVSSSSASGTGKMSETDWMAAPGGSGERKIHAAVRGSYKIRGRFWVRCRLGQNTTMRSTARYSLRGLLCAFSNNI